MKLYLVTTDSNFGDARFVSASNPESAARHDCLDYPAKTPDGELPIEVEEVPERLVRERFSNALGGSLLSQEDEDAEQAAKSAWMK